MEQLGFLDFDIHLQCIDKVGDPLATLDATIEREIFQPIIEKARKKSNAGTSYLTLFLPDHVGWHAFNESQDLQDQVETYPSRYAWCPEAVLVNEIYGTNDTRKNLQGGYQVLR